MIDANMDSSATIATESSASVPSAAVPSGTNSVTSKDLVDAPIELYKQLSIAELREIKYKAARVLRKKTKGALKEKYQEMQKATEDFEEMMESVDAADLSVDDDLAPGRSQKGVGRHGKGRYFKDMHHQHRDFEAHMGTFGAEEFMPPPPPHPHPVPPHHPFARHGGWHHFGGHAKPPPFGEEFFAGDKSRGFGGGHHHPRGGFPMEFPMEQPAFEDNREVPCFGHHHHRPHHHKPRGPFDFGRFKGRGGHGHHHGFAGHGFYTPPFDPFNSGSESPSEDAPKKERHGPCPPNPLD
ncbi:hypothetical protein DASC09_044540 [Saccharomycopsis crataegensis]|uniref:Uncharacterized protein n=1 Tax=Saccharomycopsis crataegensis TaxID=43959 RepID=A0AAV5QQY2_9ASCO|nr:hypothetical protein DASC09_044540 [Saccharomycopsis crataegensis]